jgi:polygalacturonase
VKFDDYHPDKSGRTLVADLLNRAIRDVHEHPEKDTLVVSEGRYLVASIYLLSNVRLHLLEGAVLLASLDLSDYQEDGPDHGILRRGVVVIKDASNVIIDGPGTIDGQWQPERIPRLNLMLINASRVTLRDYRSIHHMGWNTLVLHSDHVLIHGVTIQTHPESGNIDDGIDIVSSHDVEVAHCSVSVVDDGIVVKNKDWLRRPFDVYNIHIHDNTVSSKYVVALKLGTESTPGNWSNILFENNKCPDGSLAVFISDGAVVKDVTFRNNDFYHSRDRRGENGPDILIQIKDREYGVLRKAPGEGSIPGTGRIERVNLEHLRFHDPEPVGATRIRGNSPQHGVGVVRFDQVYFGDSLVKDRESLRLDATPLQYVNQLDFTPDS